MTPSIPFSGPKFHLSLSSLSLGVWLRGGLEDKPACPSVPPSFRTPGPYSKLSSTELAGQRGSSVTFQDGPRDSGALSFGLAPSHPEFPRSAGSLRLRKGPSELVRPPAPPPHPITN